MSETITIQIRITQELKDRIQQEADKDKRSVNNFLTVFLEEHIGKQPNE